MCRVAREGQAGRDPIYNSVLPGAVLTLVVKAARWWPGTAAYGVATCRDSGQHGTSHAGNQASAVQEDVTKA